MNELENDQATSLVSNDGQTLPTREIVVEFTNDGKLKGQSVEVNVRSEWEPPHASYSGDFSISLTAVGYGETATEALFNLLNHVLPNKYTYKVLFAQGNDIVERIDKRIKDDKYHNSF